MRRQNSTAIDMAIAAAVVFLAFWFWGGGVAVVPENPFPDGTPRCHIHHEARRDADIRTIGSHGDLRSFFGEGLRLVDDDVRPSEEPWATSYDWVEAKGGGRYFVMRSGTKVERGEIPEGLEAGSKTLLDALEAIR